MQMSKALIIGQVVFMGALGAVVFTQMRGSHAPAPAAHRAEDKAEEHADKDKAAPGEKAEHDKSDHADKAEHAEKTEHGEKAEAKDKEHKGAAHGEKGLTGDAMAIARELLAGNDRFAGGHHVDLNLSAQREGSAGGQHPAAMVLGCADSRVPPELIFDRGIGELFVVRSAGNIAEPVAVGSLEYAAEHLHPKVLVILGHDECGAVQAALAGGKMPSENLQAVVGYILPALKPLKGWSEGPELIRMGVEANVRRQSEELLRRSSILRKAVSGNEITILRAVYDIHSGHVRPL
jgi:carbonic anhydrase